MVNSREGQVLFLRRTLLRVVRKKEENIKEENINDRSIYRYN
jgi:hypothetical protein